MSLNSLAKDLAMPLVKDAITSLEKARDAGSATTFADSHRKSAIAALEGAANILNVVLNDPTPSKED